MGKPRNYLPKRSEKNRKAGSQKSTLRSALPWVGGALLLMAIVVGALVLARPQGAEAAPGQRMPIQGQQHIEPGQSHPRYNSDPPTSGWHYPEDLAAGFYEEPYPDELLVHNLEHGHIVISYDCGRLADCQAAKDELRRLFRAYNGWKLTVVPRQNADAAIALTAWGWIDKMDGFDEDRIRRFVDAWRDRGPEATMN